MATGKVSVSDIYGLSPAVEPTQSDKVFILSGRNYIFDTKGPNSAFGDRLLSPIPRSNPAYTQSIRLHLSDGDRCFTFDGDGIWEWREDLGNWAAIYLADGVTLRDYRWTHGYLANLVYFCHPDIGILVYDPTTGLCVPHAQLGLATPTNPYALVVDNGHLCVMDPFYFSWSSPGDGLDFTPALGKGGFQAIADLVSGAPIMITSYTAGCLTWTTGGVLRSEYTGDESVFRHRALNTEYRPANSFCTSSIDDNTVLILDERGLFQSKGDSPVSYAPLFNEFLLGYIQDNRLKVGENLRIEFDALRNHLYVSVSLSQVSAVYEQCFVYYPPIDKWGEFSQNHYCIMPILIDGSLRDGDYYGFVDSDGRVRYWGELVSRESRPEISDYGFANLFAPVIDKPTQYDSGVTCRIMPTSGRASTYDRTGLISRAGFYFGASVTPALPVTEGLDSLIRIGLIRPTGPTSVDETSEVLGVLIRSSDSGPYDVTRDDYQLDGSTTEDWMGAGVTGNEDWGFNVPGTVNHTLEIVGTLDGNTDFQRVTPELVSFNTSARYYSCSVTGVWHIVEIGAKDVGDSYVVKTCELTVASAGRLL